MKLGQQFEEAPRPVCTETGDRLELSEQDLQHLLEAAIARHGEAQRRSGERVLTLEDALEVARQLEVPEEHVLAAAEDLRLRRRRDERKALMRKERRDEVASDLQTAVIITGILAVAYVLHWPALMVWAGAGMALVTWVSLAVDWWKSRQPISDEEADNWSGAVIRGTCRVCGEAAYSGRATYCEAHRRKRPGGTAE